MNYLFTETPQHVVNSAATISECGKYRYKLYRAWDTLLPPIVWIMLNPSTADALADDPTIRKCIAFSKRLGHGSLYVVNLFALRSTNPIKLCSAADPIGPENDATIRDVCRDRSVIAAWGSNKMAKARSKDVGKLLAEASSVRCLRLTGGGMPWHPLYVPGNVETIPFEI